MIEPRHDRKSPRPWLDLFFAMKGWLAVIAAVVLIGFTIVSVINLRDALRLEADGQWATAQIVARRVRYDDENDDYFATFVFKPPHWQIRKEREVGRNYYLNNKVGDTVNVKYWPPAPALFEFNEGSNRKSGRVMQAIAGVAGLVGLAMLWFMGARTNRAVKSRQYGLRTTATIDRFVERKNSGRPTGRGYMIFTTADGLRGESLDHNIRRLRALGSNTQIVVFVRGKDIWWEGDVGPRATAPSRLPRVSGRPPQ